MTQLFRTPGLDYRPDPENLHPRAGGAGVMLSADWCTYPVVALVQEAVDRGWDVDHRRGDEWFRLASPTYVAWIVRQNRRMLADLAPPHREDVKRCLRGQFDLACGLYPFLEVWAKKRVDVPDGYLGPGENHPLYRIRHCFRMDYQIGPPYPGRIYTLSDVNEQDRKFLLDKKPTA